MDYVGIKEYTNMREMLALEFIRKRNKNRNRNKKAWRLFISISIFIYSSMVTYRRESLKSAIVV